MALEGVEYSRRYYRRTSTPSIGWMPWGLLPLLGLVGTGLFALGPFAQVWIQGETRETSRIALDRAGMQWVKLEVDGQNVHLTGQQPEAGAGDKAKALVAENLAATWAMAAVPAITVTGEFATAKPKPVPPPAAPAPAVGGMDWTWRLADKVLTLEGEVPDQATKVAFVTAAEKKADKVVDKLIVRNTGPSAGFAAMGMRGISTLSRCNQGTASWRSEVFSLRCVIDKASAAAVETDAKASPQAGKVGKVELLVPEDVEKCEAAMADLMSKSKIQFDSGKASIQAGSFPLLDEIATEAKACPGSLRIEGHTDSQGADEMNLALSQARAEATREALISRGVKATNLKAQGFGEAKPVGDNATPGGRATNRRIEFRVSLED